MAGIPPKVVAFPGCLIVWLALSHSLGAQQPMPEKGQVVNDKARFQQIKDLEFARPDGQSLKLDLYLPKEVSNPPLVVWIHGGGWRGGSKAKPPIRRITDSGFALASISYRFSDKAIFPAQIHDCKAAVRWLRAHADQYAYDGDWIAAAGSSAGGHLALLLGTSAGVQELEGEVGGNAEFSSSVQAVLDYFGPSDFVLRGSSQPEMAYSAKAGSFALLGGKPGERLPEAIEKLASPATYVSNTSPALLMFHGTDDARVLPDQSERMLELYQQADRPVELIMVPGAGHGGTAFFWSDHLNTAIDFLQKSHAGFVKPTPPLNRPSQLVSPDGKVDS